MLEGNNPRFPWEPYATMLTYRLADSSEAFGVRSGRTRTSSSPTQFMISPPRTLASPGIFVSHGESSRGLYVADLRRCTANHVPGVGFEPTRPFRDQRF